MAVTLKTLRVFIIKGFAKRFSFVNGDFFSPDNYSVFGLSGFGTHETPQDVIQHLFGFAFQRVSPAARTRRCNPDNIARLYRDDICISKIDFFIGPGIEEKRRRFAGFTPICTPRGKVRAIAVAGCDSCIRRVGLEFKNSAATTTPA